MTEPARTPLVTIATTDLCAITRGRSISAASLKETATRGVGWVPANSSLTPFDIIADPNPWGSQGDLRLLPDLAARYRVASSRAPTPFDLVMADIVELDGAPWEGCPRSILKRALADFEAETGLAILSAFEQEFQIVGAPWRPAPAFSLQALRRCDPFAPELMSALDEAGVEPEVFLPEYGRDQFEISCGPALGEASADRAAAVREIVKEIARLNGLAATFAPKTSEDGVGNGVHLHLSFRDKSGASALFDASRPGRLSSLGGAFCAGVLAHLPAITALTAPSVASYLRLQPHHWSAAWTWLGERDREATLRICPTSPLGGARVASQFNVEYRAADATACPHLVLAAVTRAGLEGVRARLASPPIVGGDPIAMSEDERGRLGLRRLPHSLQEALSAMADDKVVSGWFSAPVLETYHGLKRREIAVLDGLDTSAMLDRYIGVY
ncbi:MAG TPA: glutamine synthetase family protein [Roseiarcus sp.]|nr:glutamine synthetase family protein [Roseiarcus sp.]